MITYLNHEHIDKTLWDACIEHAPNGNAYAWSWVLDIVHPEWDALVEVSDGKYLSVMPITKKKKFGISYLCQPFFTQQLGVFSLQTLTPEQVLAFLHAIPQKYRLVEIRLNEGNTLMPPLKGVEIHRNHLLDLRLDYDSILSHYHENTYRNLKKSLKYGMRIVEGVPMTEVIALFRRDRGASVRHWGDREYARLEALATAAVSAQKAFVVGVRNPDSETLLAGALFLRSHQRITFLFSGNSAAGKEQQAMTFLIDHVIRAHTGQPLTFDFEGSDDDNLARFYQGFGSVAVTYPGVRYRLFPLF